MIVNGKIHVFDGKVRKMIFRCPESESISAFELHKDKDEQWLLWVTTIGGNVYKKKLMPSASSLSNELMETDGGSNQSIFDDLLNENEPDFTDFSTDCSKLPDNVCEISEEDKVLACNKNISCVACAKDFLIVVCADGDESVMMVYSLSDVQSQVSPDVAIRLPLPSCRFPQSKNTSSCQFSRLSIVTPEEDNRQSSSQVCVPAHLFSLLFGWEASVRSLPIVMCSLMDGSVYFHPVDLSAGSLQQLSWQLLCKVDSPVVDLLCMKMNRTLSEQESVAAELHSALGLSVRTPSHSLLDAFLVVGASGKCCGIAAMPTLGAAASSADCHKVVAMFSLPGSVGSSCCQENMLYVSSLSSQILKCQLTLVRQEGREKARFSISVRSEHLFSASVSSMWFSGEENSLLCQTVKGDLIEIDSAPSTCDRGNTKATQQPSLKDLLLGVDISQAALNELKATQMQYNAFLQQMNAAAYLLHQNSHTNALRGQKAAPISCKVTIQSDIGYHEVEYYLLLEVTNHSSVTLTRDWSVVAILHDVNGSHASKPAECGERELPSSHSFPLSQDLSAERQIDLRIPVTYSPISCGVQVSVSLVLQFPEHLRKETSGRDLFGESVFVPLTESVVDVFHFLYLKQAGCTAPLWTDPQTCVERRVGELKRGAGWGQSTWQSERKKSAGQIYSISQLVSVSAEAFPTPAQILRKLLKDSQAKGEALHHPSCSVQAPCGSVLTVAVEPTPVSNASPVNPSTDDKVYTIVLKSANISLLARARLALTRRLQGLGNKHRDVGVEEFQKMIQKTETFQRQLQAIQDKWEKGDNTPKGALSELCAIQKFLAKVTQSPLKERPCC
ncbi:uncharacterized protein LOC143297949 [Babylonia areolata]|uniref:uncharacterized protein LOC143297949 n=1 Tax=Babylonia areolata TaxID=304850 RepID=UPI003FD4AA08